MHGELIMPNRVRLSLDIERLAACLRHYLDDMPVTEKTSAQLQAFTAHLRSVRESFNKHLQFEDLRQMTVSRAAVNDTVFGHLFLNKSYDGSGHQLCRLIGRIDPIAGLVDGRSELIVGYRQDSHSYLCELSMRGGKDVVALALYVDPPGARIFTVFWIGEVTEVNRIRTDLVAEETWLEIWPDYRRWLESQQ